MALAFQNASRLVTLGLLDDVPVIVAFAFCLLRVHSFDVAQLGLDFLIRF
jgi:hypothetical protein